MAQDKRRGYTMGRVREWGEGESIPYSLLILPTAMNAIETHELSRTFGQLLAVDRLTLAIPQGTVFGFLGPNGAGKTTTVRMLAALIAPTGGGATVVGHELGVQNDAIRRSVGILTETPGLYSRLTAL